MSLSAGDLVIPAGSFNGEGGAADLSVGSLCPEGLNLGYYGTTSPIFTMWSRGGSQGSAPAETSFRKCAGYSGTDLFGKEVQLPGKSPVFRGVVVQQLDVELATVGGTGALEPVVVVQTKDFQYVAKTTSVEEI